MIKLSGLISRVYQAGVRTSEKMKIKEADSVFIKAAKGAAAVYVIPALFLLAAGYSIIFALTAAPAVIPFSPVPFVAVVYPAAMAVGLGAVAVFLSSMVEESLKTVWNGVKGIGSIIKSLFQLKKPEVSQAVTLKVSQPASMLGQKEVASTFDASAAPVAAIKEKALAQTDKPSSPK